eukprot:PITA_31127
MMGGVWYIDCGASFHMAGDKNLFSGLEEKDLKMCLEMGDNIRYSVLGVGTVAFQRERGAPLTLTDVMYVARLKKNLVLVAMLEEKGYDVVFSKGEVFLRHIDMGQTKRIRIQGLQLQAAEELLVPKEEEPHTDVEQPHAEVLGVETSAQAESSRGGRKCTREDDRLLEDARENVGAPSYQHRQRRSPERYTGYMSLVGECVETEPSSFEEAVQQLIWVGSMVEEYDSIVRNSVWDVVPRLENKSVVSSCWLYKAKKAADGSVEKHKARFVARGFSQVEGIDYDETFSPVVRYSSIRSMLTLSTQMGWKIHQMDVKAAFLNG